jgi:hypothetical protein
MGLYRSSWAGWGGVAWVGVGMRVGLDVGGGVGSWVGRDVGVMLAACLCTAGAAAAVCCAHICSTPRAWVSASGVGWAPQETSRVPKKRNNKIHFRLASPMTTGVTQRQPRCATTGDPCQTRAVGLLRTRRCSSPRCLHLRPLAARAVGSHRIRPVREQFLRPAYALFGWLRDNSTLFPGGRSPDG